MQSNWQNPQTVTLFGADEPKDSIHFPTNEDSVGDNSNGASFLETPEDSMEDADSSNVTDQNERYEVRSVFVDDINPRQSTSKMNLLTCENDEAIKSSALNVITKSSTDSSIIEKQVIDRSSSSPCNSSKPAEYSKQIQQAKNSTTNKTSLHDTAVQRPKTEHLVKQSQIKASAVQLDLSSNLEEEVFQKANVLKQVNSKRIVKTVQKNKTTKSVVKPTANMWQKPNVRIEESAPQRTSSRKRIIPKDYPVNLLGKNTVQQKVEPIKRVAEKLPTLQQEAKRKVVAIEATVAPLQTIAPSKSVAKAKEIVGKTKIHTVVSKPNIQLAVAAPREMRTNRKPTAKLLESYDPKLSSICNSLDVKNKTVATRKRKLSNSANDEDGAEKPKRVDLPKKSAQNVPSQKSKTMQTNAKNKESAKSLTLPKIDKAVEKHAPLTLARAKREIKPTLKLQEFYKENGMQLLANRNFKNKSLQKNDAAAVAEGPGGSKSKPVKPKFSLFDMTKEQLVKSFGDYKNLLDGIFNELKNKPNVVHYKGVDHSLVMPIITRENEQFMSRRLRQEYENHTVGPSQHTLLYFNAMLPEWILRITMKKYKLKREDIIQQLKQV